MIDLSNISIREIRDNAFLKMKNNILLDLTKNKLSDLLCAIQKFAPCRTAIGIIIINCDCSHTWLTDWVKTETGRSAVM